MSFQELLDEAFPPDADANLIRGVSEGIFLADSTMESANFLSSPVGLDLRGHMRRSGVLFRLHQMATSGDLPFASSMKQMPRGNWHWIEIQSKGFVSHVCRTDAPSAFPDDTPTRQDDRVTNQIGLWEDTTTIVPLKGYMAWLTFGVGDSGTLSHLCWGMPNAEEDFWLARTNVIRRARESVVVVPFEAPTKAAELKFREHVEDALRGKDEQGETPA